MRAERFGGVSEEIKGVTVSEGLPTSLRVPDPRVMFCWWGWVVVGWETHAGVSGVGGGWWWRASVLLFLQLHEVWMLSCVNRRPSECASGPGSSAASPASAAAVDREETRRSTLEPWCTELLTRCCTHDQSIAQSRSICPVWVTCAGKSPPFAPLHPNCPVGKYSCGRS